MCRDEFVQSRTAAARKGCARKGPRVYAACVPRGPSLLMLGYQAERSHEKSATVAELGSLSRCTRTTR